MTILEPMSPERFDEFVAAVTPSHAADNVASGRWPEHEALTLARAELDRLLPSRPLRPITISMRSRSIQQVLR